MKIVSLDLGKYKTVSCEYEGGVARFFIGAWEPEGGLRVTLLQG